LGIAVPLNRLIADNSFSPDEIQAMTAAYESALVDLKLGGGDNPIKTELAKAILTVTTAGERDPKKIKQLALMILVRED
jgi:hypothetical protein